MAFKINLKAACKWPEKLSRAIDVDGAFRMGALLAAMRVIAPRGRGDGFDRHFSDASYPPDFAEVDARNVDAYRAMGALFIWDGGESTIQGDYVKPGDVFDLSPVKAGEIVFRDVWERDIGPGSPSGYSIERMALRGEVHSCFASQFPYRYWWHAFNRAIKELTTASPRYNRSVYIPGYGDEYSEEYSPGVDTSIEIFPYVFSHTPTGVAALTPDDLCTGWVDLESTENTTKVSESMPWLLTAEDIDFGGVFVAEDDDKRSHPLRTLWASFANAIGFGNYVSEDAVVDRSVFKDGIETFWRGETEPRYGDDRLAQLEKDWQGIGDEWRDEFPYHGLSAMLAYLEYFERRNIGFAMACDYIDQIRKIQHFSKSCFWERKVSFEVPIPAYGTEDIEIGTYPIKDLNWGEVEKNEHENWHYDHPYAHASRSRPKVAASALAADKESIGFYVTTLYRDAESGFWSAWCDGDNNAFECFLNGGAAAMEDRLNELAAEALGAADEESLIGTMTVYASLSADSSITRVDERDWHDLGAFGTFAEIPSDDMPFARRLLDTYSSEYRRYFFLRTSFSCAIAKQYNFNIAAKLNAEVGIPSSGELSPILTDPGQNDGTIKVTLKGTAEKLFEVVESPLGERMSFFIDLPDRSETVEGPLPYIYANTAHGRVLVFPPETEPVNSYELSLVVPSRGVAVVEVDSKPSEEMSDEDFFSNSSRLEFLRSIAFMKYDENVIYPD